MLGIVLGVHYCAYPNFEAWVNADLVLNIPKTMSPLLPALSLAFPIALEKVKRDYLNRQDYRGHLPL